jgi:catechol 2,3-dioxygenase-like lactoylglutathione lyase family enzyme
METTNTSSTGASAAFAPLGAVLGVRDIAQASRFYQTLGFREETALAGADGRLTVAILSYGSSTLLLGRLDELHYENQARAEQIRRGPAGLGVTLTLLVPDLLPIYSAVKEARLPILLEPVDEFYGDRVFVFLDPDGYEWKISQTIKDVPPEEIAAIVAGS